VVTEEQEKEQQQEEEKRRSGAAAAPGQVTSLRRLGGRGSGAAQAEPERKKRGWGATRGSRLRSGQLESVFRIRIQIHMFLGLPDPLVRGTVRIRILLSSSTNSRVRKTLILTLLFCDFFMTFYCWKIM
jgi:hypothetical protein